MIDGLITGAVNLALFGLVVNLRVMDGIWAGTAATPEMGLIVSLVTVGFSVLVGFSTGGRARTIERSGGTGATPAP